MPGIFGGDSGFNVDAALKKSGSTGKHAVGRALGVLNLGTRSADRTLRKAIRKIDLTPGPTTLNTPGLNVNLTNSGIDVTRSNETQGFMDNLKTGMTDDENRYTSLLEQLHPGFGKVTEARRAAIEAAARKATGDLSSQLQRRRIAGSSFANDQVASTQAEYDKMRSEADAQSFLDELQATQNIIQQRTTARVGAIQTALGQINFESGVGAQLLQSAQQNAMQAQALMAGLAQTNAQLHVSAAQTGANIIGGIAQTQLGTYPQYAQLQAQSDAGAGSALGSIFGTVVGGAFGGPQGAALGSQIGGGVFGKSSGSDIDYSKLPTEWGFA